MRSIAFFNWFSSAHKTSTYQCSTVFCIKIACGNSCFTSLQYSALLTFILMCLVELNTPHHIFCDSFSDESSRTRCFCGLFKVLHVHGQYRRNSSSFGSYYRAVFILLFYLLHKVCDDQHDHTHQLGDTFFWLDIIKSIIYYRNVFGHT